MILSFKKLKCILYRILFDFMDNFLKHPQISLRESPVVFVSFSVNIIADLEIIVPQVTLNAL